MLNSFGSMIALFAAGKVAIGIKSVHVALRVQLLKGLGSSIAYLVSSSIIKVHIVFAMRVSYRIACTGCMVTSTSLDPMHWATYSLS